MQGTILSPGLISGSDGQRYSYEPSDIRNAQVTPSIGMQVDFTPLEGGKAGDIYLIVSESVINNAADASAVRTKAIVAIVFGILGFIPFLGWIFLLIAFILWIMVYRHISRVTGIKGFILLIIGGVLFGIIGSLVSLAGGVGGLMGGGRDFDFISILGSIISLLSALCYLMVNFKLSKASGVGLFKITAIIRLFSCIPVIGWIIAIIAAILEIISWVKVDKLINHKN